MTTAVQLEPDQRRFRLTEIVKSRAPTGAEGTNWYQYTLTGASIVTCYSRGTRKEVIRHANRFADQLNERVQDGRVPHISRRRK